MLQCLWNWLNFCTISVSSLDLIRLMTNPWHKTVIPIALLFSFRMLGLFMLIPVFTLYAPELVGATPALIGIALGAYGLSQGLLQIPFGILSDKFGRKPLITLGLVLFAAGSLLGALTHSIYGMLAARILQGGGAIGSVLIALLADLTPEASRTKAMAVIGMTIGLSFSLAMVLSPIIAHWSGLSGIFYLTCILACLGLIVLHTVIPSPQRESFHPESEAKPSLLKVVLGNKTLWRLNAGIFCQHLILTSTFFVLPNLLKENIAQGLIKESWHVYLALMLIAFILMIPFIIIAEKKGRMREIFLAAIVLSGASQFLLAIHGEYFLLFYLLLQGYFVAFNFLEASLPSMVSKLANPSHKGTAMGVYSTCQFLGIFAGGTLSGLLFNHIDSAGIFVMNGIIACAWFIFSYPLQPERQPLKRTTLEE